MIFNQCFKDAPKGGERGDFRLKFVESIINKEIFLFKYFLNSLNFFGMILSKYDNFKRQKTACTAQIKENSVSMANQRKFRLYA